jgi:hypothetical protein
MNIWNHIRLPIFIKKVNAGEYGEGVTSKIANKIKEQYPTLNGFSKRGLYQIIQSTKSIRIIKKCEHCSHN